MWKIFSLGLFATLLSGASALACSCGCNFEFTISEYLQSHKVFWGVPTESQLERYERQLGQTDSYRVISQVTVLEGYGRLQSGTTVEVVSAPDDGASCGTQLYTGVPQLIIANTAGDRNYVGTCTCTPPIAHLLDHLKDGKDIYIPDLNDCWGENDKIKSGKKCEVWRDAPDEHQLMHAERMKMIKKFRNLDLENKN